MADVFCAGAKVRVIGLVRAAQHNGKCGIVTKRSATQEGRVGVKLAGDGGTLSVRRANLEPLLPSSSAEEDSLSAICQGLAKQCGEDGDQPLGKERTLERDTSLLEEFRGSRDPDVLVLYHHFRDQAFDCFNAQARPVLNCRSEK